MMKDDISVGDLYVLNTKRDWHFSHWTAANIETGLHRRVSIGTPFIIFDANPGKVDFYGARFITVFVAGEKVWVYDDWIDKYCEKIS